MSTLKDRLKQSMYENAESYDQSIKELYRLISWIDEQSWLDLNSDSDWIHTWSSGFEIYTKTPGRAQELANVISTEMGIEMVKSFKENTGMFSYSGITRVFDDRFLIGLYITGAPPESCELVEVRETKEIVRFEVKCE